MDTKIPQNNRPAVCRSCGETEAKFGLRGNGHGKWYYHLDCWNCRYRQQRDRENRARDILKAKDPEAWKRKRRNAQLKRYYKMTLDEYETKLELQGGGCAICGKTRELKDMPVDHCHSKGHIRAILCHYCNKGLGQFFDNPEILRKAADYIDEWNR